MAVGWPGRSVEQGTLLQLSIAHWFSGLRSRLSSDGSIVCSRDTNIAGSEVARLAMARNFTQTSIGVSTWMTSSSTINVCDLNTQVGVEQLRT
jgi:hypothetical protein